MKPDRILHLIPRIPVSRAGIALGGSAVSVLSLVNAQHRFGACELNLVSGAVKYDGPLSRLVPNEVRVRTLPMRSRPVSHLYGLEFVARVWSAGRQLRTLQADIVHGHSGRWNYAVAAFLLARYLDRPWVYSLYCPLDGDQRATRPVPTLISRLLSRAAIVTGMSENVVRSIERVGVPVEKLHHVDPCVDTSRFRARGRGAEVRTRLEIPADAPMLLFVGNPSRAKGFDVLWEAFRSLRIRRPDACLVGAFEHRGTAAASRATEAYSGAEREAVRFLGLVNDMPALLEAADVVVVPFRTTQGPSDYPLVVLEAMAVGTPVVATNVGGIPELLRHGETGIPVPAGDVAALVRALTDLLMSDSLGQRLAGSATELIRRRFSPEVVTRRWSEIYETLQPR